MSIADAHHEREARCDMRSCCFYCLLMFILVYLGSAQSVAQEAVPHGTHDVTLDLLLPTPHEMEAGTGYVSLGSSIRLSAPEKWVGAVDRYLWVLNEVLHAKEAGPVTVVKEPSAAAIRVLRKAQGTLPENGYELKIGAGVIELAAPDPGGVFNGPIQSQRDPHGILRHVPVPGA
jgi:hypothetical protein